MLKDVVGLSTQVVTHLPHRGVKFSKPLLMAGQENLLNPAPTNTVDVLVDLPPPLWPAFLFKSSQRICGS